LLITELIKRILCSIIYFNKFIIFEKLLFDTDFFSKLKKNYTVRIANEIDIKNMKDIIGSRRVNLFLRRLKENKLCMIALDGDKIVYYRWLNFDKENLVTLREKEVYLFDAYTWPAYRRQGIHTAVTAACLTFAKEKGCEKALVVASVRNYSAQKTLKNLGFKKMGKVNLIRIPWLNWEYKLVKRLTL